MTVYGQAVITKFTRKHAAARKPFARFLALANDAAWPHFPAVKETFQGTDYAPATGTLIFNIGGNKYRLIALVNFEKQSLLITSVLTHEEYERENL